MSDVNKLLKLEVFPISDTKFRIPHVEAVVNCSYTIQDALPVGAGKAKLMIEIDINDEVEELINPTVDDVNALENKVLIGIERHH